MPKITWTFDAKDQNAVAAAQRVTESMHQAEQAGVKFTTNVGRGASGLSSALGGITQTLGPLIGGFTALGAVGKIFSELAEQAEKLRRINEQLTNESVGTQRSLLAMAQQEGITTQEAARRVADTATKTGAGTALAAEARRAVHSLMGVGAIQQGRQDIIAGALAAYGGSPEQATQLTEALMRAPEVKDESSLLRALSQMRRAMRDSPYSTLGEFAGSFGRGQLTAMQQGMPLKESLAFQAQARMVTANPTQAARMMEQLYRVLWTEHGRSMVEEETGRSPDTMDITAQFKGLLSAVAKKKPEELQAMFDADLVPSRERQWLFNFTTKAAREAHDRILKSLDEADPEEMKKVMADYKQSAVGQVTAMESVEQVRHAQLGTYLSVAGKQSEQARHQLDKRYAEGKIGWFHYKLLPVITRGLETERLVADTEAAMQLENLGIAEKPGAAVSRGPYGPPDTTYMGLQGQLRRVKEARGLPWESIITPGGEAVLPDNSVRRATTRPVTVNHYHYGPQYHIGQPAAMSQPAAESQLGLE